MTLEAQILKEVSYDPYYKIKFSIRADGTVIEKGYAEIVRKSPKPVITYDPNTEQIIQTLDKSKLELELLNLVIREFLSKRR